MKRFKVGQYLKPRKHNRFWKAFKILTVDYNTSIKYDVRCYGHKGKEQELTMDHVFIENTVEKITEESFKNIMG